MLASQHFGDIEPTQQIAPYSCGAAVLKAVLQHWGERADERSLIHEIGIDPKAGSTAEQVAVAARRRGYAAQTKQFKSIDELTQYTANGIPVIVAIQSFIRPQQGHFVIATKIKPDRVEIMDPNVRGNRRVVPRHEMDRRWRFRDRVGVVVTPRRASARPSLGDSAGGLEPRHVFTLVTVGIVTVTMAATIGVAIYRRHRTT